MVVTAPSSIERTATADHRASLPQKESAVPVAVAAAAVALVAAGWFVRRRRAAG